MVVLSTNLGLPQIHRKSGQNLPKKVRTVNLAKRVPDPAVTELRAPQTAGSRSIGEEASQSAKRLSMAAQ